MKGPIDLVIEIAALLDSHSIPYALGGSVAMSFFGEPRSTNDVDIAVRASSVDGVAFLSDVPAEFYVPRKEAQRAWTTGGSFNLVDTLNALKVDLFVVGDGLLDRRQIDRRQLMALPGAPAGIWVTSPEDQILRKLTWHREGSSERQWRDVVGLVSATLRSIDLVDLSTAAEQLGVVDLLDAAIREAAEGG